jgi:hypothetical protein
VIKLCLSHFLRSALLSFCAQLRHRTPPFGRTRSARACGARSLQPFRIRSCDLCPHCSLCANSFPKCSLWKEWIAGWLRSSHPILPGFLAVDRGAEPSHRYGASPQLRGCCQPEPPKLAQDSCNRARTHEHPPQLQGNSCQRSSFCHNSYQLQLAIATATYATLVAQN